MPLSRSGPRAPEKVDVAHPDPKAIESLFSSIAPRYDLLNTVLSFGIDGVWRARTVRLSLDRLGARRSLKLLDVGTGTGKLLSRFQASGAFDQAVGLDLSREMLRRARKACPHGRWVEADSLAIPFGSGCFDVIASAFALRSLPDLDGFFAECFRALSRGGWVALLELTRPTNVWMQILYVPYLKVYLPLLGRALSRHPHAYSFLSGSILHFQSPQHIADGLRKQGFLAPELHAFSGGAATLILAKKP